MNGQRRSTGALLFAACLLLLSTGRAHAGSGPVSCYVYSGNVYGGFDPVSHRQWGVQCTDWDDTYAWLECAPQVVISCHGAYEAIADRYGARCYDAPNVLSGTPEYCPHDGGGGGGCALSLGGPQETFVFGLNGSLLAPALPKSSFVLSRMEAGDDKISFLMDEWAVIGTVPRPGDAAPRLTVLRASSPAFAAAKERDLAASAGWAAKKQRRGAQEPSDEFLIVEAPIHPHNSRYAPMPDVKLSSYDVPAGMPARTLLVRADFTEKSDAPRWLQVLHADGPVSREMRDLVKSRLALDHTSVARHRTVVFASVTIGDVLELKPLATVTPKCCCGDWFCE